MAKPVYRTKQWQQLRAQVLAEETHCHWCRKPLTSTAQVDHLIEIDRGGMPYDRANLVASCRSCNARRGAKYKALKEAESRPAAKRATKGPQKATQPAKAARPASKGTGTGFFGGEPQDPVRLVASSLSERGTGAIKGKISLVGRAEPRLVSPLPDGMASFGDELAVWAAQVAKVNLLPWQHRLVHDLLAYDPDTGRPCWSSATLSTGRQNGKSLLLGILAGWWLCRQAERRGQPQQVIVVSNKLSRAMHILLMVGAWLEPLGATVRRGNNQPSVTMPDGSVLLALAATPDQHGHTADLICIDELFDIHPDVYFGAFLPAQRTRKHSLICGWSTAGDQSSELLLKLRARGIDGISTGQPGRAFFCEFSPPPGVDPQDKQWWPWANPSLGHLIDPEELEEEARNDWATFVRTGLNQWVTSMESWLPLGAWEKQATLNPMPAGGVLAVEKAPEDSRWVGLRAVTTEQGVQVHVEFAVTSEQAMLAETARVMRDPKVQLLMPPGIDLRLPPQLARRTKTVGVREIRLWTSPVQAMIINGEVWHDSHQVLAEHVNRAVAKTVEGSWYVMAARSPGPIELCRCLIWAVAIAAKPKAVARAAMASA